jgi:hypothetical protein
VLQQLGQGARGDDLSAEISGAGAHVDDKVGGGHGLWVVLDDDDGVAEIPQADEGAQEALGVPGVQAHRGLIQHIDAAREAAAELGREANPLGLAARERRRAAVEADVAQADVPQKAQSSPHLVQGLGGDGRLCLI